MPTDKGLAEAQAAAEPAAEIQVRRARTDKKVEKYAEKGEFNVLTTTRTPPEKFDLVLSGQSDSEDTEDAALLTPVITLEIVQGYSVTAPREPVALQRGGKAELAGAPVPAAQPPAPRTGRVSPAA